MTRARQTCGGVCVVVAAVVLIAPGRALAQADVATARALFEQGVAALDAGQYADAATALEASYRARPSPPVLYNLGLALRGAGRYGAAIEAFERYLAYPSASATADELARVRATVEELRAALATVDLVVGAPGATLVVDGRARAWRGEPLRLDPGDHALEVRVPGCTAATRELRLERATHTRIALPLVCTGATGVLQVEAPAPGAVVTVDGARWAPTQTRAALAAGEHDVRVTAPRCAPYARRVRVTAGATVRLDVQLAPRAGTNVGLYVGLGVGGAVVAATAITLGAVLGSAATAAPYEPTLGNVQEGIRVR